MRDMTKQLIPKSSRLPRVSTELVVLFVVFASLVGIFAKIADEVLERDTIGPDVYILHAVHSLSSPWLDHMVPLVTNIGGPIGGVVVAVAIVGAIWLYGKRRDAIVVAVSVAGAALLNLILKAIFVRPRPDEWARIVNESSYSFPSGHAMASAALTFALIVVSWRSRWRWPVLITSLFYVGMIAFTRLYLGVHYPTDIIAGWAVSALWVMIVTIMLYRRLSPKAKLTQ